MASSDVRTISSFDWHPSSTNRMLAISHSGQVADVYLRERIAMVGADDILTYSYSSSSSCGLSSNGRCRSYEPVPGLTILRSTMGGFQTNVEWC